MNTRVRELVKKDIRQRAQVAYWAVSRQQVTVVVLRVKMGEQVLEACGTSKWQKPDVPDHRMGYKLAYARALTELVDQACDPDRRGFSVRLV